MNAEVLNYLESVKPEHKEALTKIRQTIVDHLPNGFEECISYQMLGYVVSLENYPKGYHCNPKLPLPFINVGSNKNYISLHHLGLYFNPDLTNWFAENYFKIYNAKPDIGKGCIRFKKTDKIPFDLLAELFSKISVDDWISAYEKSLHKKD